MAHSIENTNRSVGSVRTAPLRLHYKAGRFFTHTFHFLSRSNTTSQHTNIFRNIFTNHCKNIWLKAFTFLLLLLLQSNTGKSQIVINEIGIGARCPNLFDCDDAGGGGEFIELFNKSACIQNIGCYVLVYSGPNGVGWSVTIPSGTTLGPGQYYLVGGNSSNFVGSSNWNAINPSTTSSWVNLYGTNGKDVADLDLKKANTSGKGMIIGNLPNTGGQITLFKSDGISISSSIAYNTGNNSGTYPVTSNSSGCSLNPIQNPGSTTPYNLGRDFSSYYAGLYLDANGNCQSSINDVGQYPSPGKANNIHGGNSQMNTASLPAANVGNNNSVCIGGAVSLGAAAVSGNSYSWTSLPAGITSTSSNFNVSPVSNTTYTLTEKDAHGCTNSNSVNISVNPLPPVNAGTDKSITLGTQTTIGPSPVSGNSYSWTSTSGFTSNIANPTVSPNQTTTFTLKETIASTGCSNTDDVILSVNACPG
ncbi:MAG TPA: lamin tail domain-containing protein, partial [Chitinophagaceae bacterium]|nr:lamin tail domain-containing protein [Chitinophagaceae bacterium]